MLLSSLWFWISSILFPSTYENSEGGAASVINNSGPNGSFHVIGAGLQRTGTFSTRIALSKLLGGKCYHGFVGSMESEPEFWLRAARGNVTVEQWKQFLPGKGWVGQS